jgi:hypothetical protein
MGIEEGEVAAMEGVNAAVLYTYVNERKETSLRPSSAGLRGSATWAKKKMRPKENRRKKKKGCYCGLIHVGCFIFFF